MIAVFNKASNLLATNPQKLTSNQLSLMILCFQ